MTPAIKNPTEWIGKRVMGRVLSKKEMGAGYLKRIDEEKYIIYCGEHRQEWIADTIHDPDDIEQGK